MNCGHTFHVIYTNGQGLSRRVGISLCRTGRWDDPAEIEVSGLKCGIPEDGYVAEALVWEDDQ